MKRDLKVEGASRYVVGEVKRFNQKNEMFKRVRWDVNVMHLVSEMKIAMQASRDKPGYTVEEQAFERAAWALERNFANGNSSGKQGLYAWDSPTITATQPEDLKISGGDPLEISRMIKRIAKFLGASLVGVCELDRRWLYSDYCNVPGIQVPDPSMPDVEQGPVEISEEYKYAIVMAFEMDYQAIRYTPTSIGAAASGRGYSEMAYTTYLLAHYILSLGYKAIPMGNDTACSIPIAIDAGLGELSRMGFLITPEYGPRVRISKIFTDLPLTPDQPIDFGVWEFCSRCEKCAVNCPGQAIMYGEATATIHNICNREGLLRWPINVEKCLGFITSNGAACSTCIRVCPFNKPSGWTHELVRWGVKYTPLLNQFFVKMDDMLGYGKKMKAEHFWKL